VGQERPRSAFDSADHGQGPEKDDENAAKERGLRRGVNFGSHTADVAITEQTQNEVQGQGDFEEVVLHEIVTAFNTAEPPMKG
jgi:hypothetical protein